MMFSTDKRGIGRINELINWCPKNDAGAEDDVIVYIKGVCEISPMSAYYLGCAQGISNEEMAQMLLDGSKTYIKSIPALNGKNARFVDNPIVEEVVGAMVAYVLCSCESVPLVEPASKIWSVMGMSPKNKNEKSAKFTKFISSFILLEDNLPNLCKKADELIMYVSYFLYKNSEFIEEKASSTIEFYTISSKIRYDINLMSPQGKIAIADYFRLLVDNCDQEVLSSFVRKIDNDFKDYESVFGMNRHDFCVAAINAVDPESEATNKKPSGLLPYRILRAYYHEYSTDPDWIKLVDECVKDEHAKEFCHAYDALASYSDKINEYSDESVFISELENVVNGIKWDFLDSISWFECKKIRMAQGDIFINVLNNGYDIKKVIEIFGEHNTFIYHKEYRADWNLFDDEMIRKDRLGAIDEFYKQYSEPEELLYVYMNSFLHDTADIREFIEAICNALAAKGLSETQVSSRVAELFADWPMKGNLCRIDEQYSFKGLYTIEAYNIYKTPEYTWTGIHNWNSKLTRDEKTYRCRLLFQSDEQSGKDGYWRFNDVDAKMYFKITGIEKNAESYKDCIILVGDLRPVTDSEGNRTGVNVANKAEKAKALDYAYEWLQTLKVENILGGIPKPKNFMLIKDPPSSMGRGNEFAIAILDVLTYHMSNSVAFKKVIRTLDQNFIDNLNEFKYKPGMINRTAENFEFTKSETSYIIGKANEVLMAQIPTKQKMQIYMNTCLKKVYFLDRFVMQLPREDRPFLYSDTDDLKYYLFPVEYKGEDEENLQFAFRCGYNSRFKDKLYIAKSSLAAENVENFKTAMNLFAEIHYFKESQNCAYLYHVFTKNYIKQDNGSYVRKALNDLKRDKDPMAMRDGIKDIVAHIPDIKRIKEPGFAKMIVDRFYNNFNENKFNAEFILNFIVYWNKTIGEEYTLDGVAFPEGTVNSSAYKLLQSIINFNKDYQKISYIVSIYKHSYLKQACPKEVLFEKLSEKIFKIEGEEKINVPVSEIEGMYNSPFGKYELAQIAVQNL